MTGKTNVGRLEGMITKVKIQIEEKLFDFDVVACSEYIILSPVFLRTDKYVLTRSGEKGVESYKSGAAKVRQNKGMAEIRLTRRRGNICLSYISWKRTLRTRSPRQNSTTIDGWQDTGAGHLAVEMETRNVISKGRKFKGIIIHKSRDEILKTIHLPYMPEIDVGDFGAQAGQQNNRWLPDCGGQTVRA